MRSLLYAIAACSAACGRQGVPPSATAAVTPDAARTTGVAPAPITPAAITPAAIAPAGDASNCLPTHDGYLRLRMRGDSNLDIDWRDADMQCDGGARPGQQGVRLTFAGPAKGGAHNLRFVFGIAAAPGTRSAHNVPANVTVIFEGEHKLFSTAGDGKCTIDQLTEQPLPAQADRHLHRVTARGFCVAPATALASKARLLLSRFDFAGPVMEEDAADDLPPVRP